MQESREWSWVDKDGIEHEAAEDELTFGLSSEELPPYILVCKRGWIEWLPAMQVAELAWALPPGCADTPHKPKVSDQESRQPPPLDKYSELETRATDIKNGAIDPTLSGVAQLPPVAPVPPVPSSVVPRPVLETIADDDVEELTVQLSPEDLSAAMNRSELYPSNGGPPSPAAGGASTSLDRGSAPAVEPGADAVLLDADDVEPLPDVTPDPPMAPGQEATLSLKGATVGAVASSSFESAPSRRRAGGLLAIALVAALFVALGSYWHFSGENSEKGEGNAPTPTPAVASTAASNRVAMQCEVSAGPARVGEWAQPKLKPILRRFMGQGGDRVAVGYAKTSRYALGVSLDPENLATEELFSNYESSPLASVSPVQRNQELDFVATRAASTLQSQIALDADPPFTFGLNSAGFAVRKHKATSDEILWPSTFENISVPSAARLGDGQFAVAYRAGGERGEIQVAKLGKQGEGVEGPVKIRSPATRVGPPALARAGDQLLVAFASGPRGRRGGLLVASSTLPALPTQAKPIRRSTGRSRAPSIDLLPNKDLLLQWTTGASGRQRVVAQAYAPDLSPAGPELSVSPSAKDAHSGVVTVVGSHVLSIYMVRSGGNHELWATTFDCL